MICNYCEHSPSKLHHHYNIQNVRERFNPTYSHNHIFQDNSNESVHVRCTPTFHSTAFDVDGYRPTTNQHLKRTAEQKSNIVNYRNASGEKKQEELNTAHRGFNLKIKNQWYDPAKQELFNSLQCTQRYSRERKLADLSSNPVFGGVTMEVINRKAVVNATQQAQQTKVQTIKQAINQQPKEEVSKAEQKPAPQQSTKPQIQATKNELIQIKTKISNQTKAPVQQFSIKNEVTFGKKGNAGKKLNKTCKAKGQKAAFTVIKSKR